MQHNSVTCVSPWPNPMLMPKIVDFAKIMNEKITEIEINFRLKKSHKHHPFSPWAVSSRFRPPPSQARVLFLLLVLFLQEEEGWGEILGSKAVVCHGAVQLVGERAHGRRRHGGRRRILGQSQILARRKQEVYMWHHTQKGGLLQDNIIGPDQTPHLKRNLRALWSGTLIVTNELPQKTFLSLSV